MNLISSFLALMYLPGFQVTFVTVLYSVHYHSSLKSDCQPDCQYDYFTEKHLSLSVTKHQNIFFFFFFFSFLLQKRFFLFDLELSNSGVQLM